MPSAQEQVKRKLKKKTPPKDTKGASEFKPAKKVQLRQSQVKDTKGAADRDRGKAEAARNIKAARVKTLRKGNKSLVEKAPGAVDDIVKYLGDKALNSRDYPGMPKTSNAAGKAFDASARSVGHGLAKIAENQLKQDPATRRAVNTQTAGLEVGLRGEAFLQAARAHIEKPSTTLKTLRQVPAAAAGAVGLVGTAVSDPKRAFKEVQEQGDADSKRRLDSLRKGDTKAFRERVKSEGGLAEVAEGAAIVGAGGGTVSRIAGLTAKARKAGPYKAPRKKLRKTAGGPAHPQRLSDDLVVATVQKARDKRREKTYEKRKAQSDVTQKRATETSRGESGTMRSLIPAEDEVVRKSLRRQGRDQRKAVAGDIGRGYVRLKSKQRTELKEGLRKNLRTLSDEESRGFKFAVQLGIRDPETARRVLSKHRADVNNNRAEKGTEILRTDEVPEIDWLIANADDVFTPKLAKVADAETARAGRTADLAPSLTKQQAETRRRMPQMETLGVKPREGKITLAIRQAEQEADLAKQGVITAKRRKLSKRHVELAESRADQAATKLVRLRKAQSQGVKTIREESNPDLLTRADRVARSEGLATPGYYLSRERPEGVSAAFSLGQTKAVKPSRKYEGELFRTGREDTNPEAFETGLARNIREGVNWSTISDIWERNSPEWGRNLSGPDVKKVIERKGLDPDAYRFVNLGAFREKVPDAESPDMRGADLHQTGDRRLHEAIENVTHDLSGAEAEFATGAKFTIVPKAVSDELRALSTPAGPVSRTVRKVQGTTSKILLHTNPTFVPVQVVAQTPLALFATKGNVKSIVASRRWAKRLDPEAKEAVDQWIGTSPGLDAAFSPRYGAATPDSKFIKFFQAVADSKKAQTAKHSRLNPMTWNPRMDEAQNRFFRTTVFYDQARRQGRENMTQAMNGVAKDAKSIIEILEMPNTPERLSRLREAEPDIERVAQHVDDWLGNYTRYTARERRYLKTGLLFYGFLRWSVRFSMYTLPVKHPVAASIATRLGQLHVEEVIDLLSDEVSATYGTEYDRAEVEKVLRENRIPGAFGRIYFTGDGELKSIDLARVSPLTGPALNFLERGVKSATSLMSPALQWGMDLVFGRSTFTGRPLDVDSKRTPFGAEPEVGTDEAVRYVFRQGTRMAWPVRALDDLMNPEEQGDDSIPILGDRPTPIQTGEESRLRGLKTLQRKREEGLARAVRPFGGPITDTTKAGVKYQIDQVRLRGPKKLKTPGKRKPLKRKAPASGGVFGSSGSTQKSSGGVFD